jgi:hypothetical protein
MKTIRKHYIDGAFVESHGREVMDIIKPTNGRVIARVTLADVFSYSVGVPEEDPYAAEYPARTFPCQRFDAALASSSA